MLPQKQLLLKLQRNGLELIKKPNLLSKQLNGVGAFVPSICRMELQYNTPREGAGGDSTGMVKWTEKYLSEFAQERPYVEIVLRHKSGKPKVTSYYNNGHSKQLIVSNWTAQDIQRLLNRLADSTRLEKQYKPTRDEYEWHPFQSSFRP